MQGYALDATKRLLDYVNRSDVSDRAARKMTVAMLRTVINQCESGRPDANEVLRQWKRERGK